MAITYVGGNTQRSGGALSLTFTIPAGAIAGDFMVVCVKQSENTSQQTWDDDGGGGNGWIREAYNRTTSGRDQESAIYYKIHSGSESNPTFTWNTSGTTEPMSGIMLVYRGVDQAVPIRQLNQKLGTNTCTPPNAIVDIMTPGTRVVCFHAATHDDISSVGAPADFTLREYHYGGSAGHNQDHTDIFSADATIDIAFPYTPGNWTHGASNSTPEYHTYTLSLTPQQDRAITSMDDDTQIDPGDSVTIRGYGFETQGANSKVELWEHPSGIGTKVEQAVTSWADDAITFTVSKGSIADGDVFIAVTTASSEVTNSFSCNLGFGPYDLGIFEPDHLWTMNNTYDDDGLRPDRPCDQSQEGPPSFAPKSICRSNSHSLLFTNPTDKTEVADSDFTNIGTTHTGRNVGGWVEVDNYTKTPKAIYEEGGGVNNFYFILGFGNILLANMADSNGTPPFKVQAFSDFTLKPNRPYYIMLEWIGGDGFYLWIDGIKQTVTTGNPVADTTFSTHSGDFCFGRPDGSLDTGGTDIQYNAMNNMWLAQWASWSNSMGNILTPAEHRQAFELGALASVTVTSDTVSNMNAFIASNINDDYFDDYPCAIKIEHPTEELDQFTLNMHNVVFDEGCSIQVMYMGSATKTLNLVVSGSTVIDPAKLCAISGATINIITKYTVTITGLIVGAELRIYDDENTSDSQHNTELDGTESLTNNYFEYLHDGVANDIKIQMIANGYEEVIIPFTLAPSNQSVALQPIVDGNI